MRGAYWFFHYLDSTEVHAAVVASGLRLSAGRGTEVLHPQSPDYSYTLGPNTPIPTSPTQHFM